MVRFFSPKKINNIGPITFLTTNFNIDGIKMIKIYEFTSVLANTGTIKETSLSNFLGESMAEKVIVSIIMPKMTSSDIIHTYKVMPGSQVFKPTCDANNLMLRIVVVFDFQGTRVFNLIQIVFQNTHAYISGGFKMNIDSSSEFRVVTRPSIVFSGIDDSFVSLT